MRDRSACCDPDESLGTRRANAPTRVPHSEECICVSPAIAVFRGVRIPRTPGSRRRGRRRLPVPGPPPVAVHAEPLEPGHEPGHELLREVAHVTLPAEANVDAIEVPEARRNLRPVAAPIGEVVRDEHAVNARVAVDVL